MKSWKNYAICIISIISIILGISRYFTIRNNFIYSLNSRIAQNTNQYGLEQYILEKSILEDDLSEEKVTNEIFIEYLKSTYVDNVNSLESVALYDKSFNKLYSYNEELENINEILTKLYDVYTMQIIKDREYNNYTLQIVNNKHYMIFSSHWKVGDETLFMVNAYDVDDLYKERDRQIRELVIRDVIILMISSIITYVCLIVITKYIEKINLQAKQKDDFINAFTHELKTPMTAIIGYSDMLRLKKCDEEVSAKALNYIYTEAKRLENLSHKLLSLMSIASEEIEFQDIEIKKFIQKLVSNILTQNEIDIDLEEAIIKTDIELLEVAIRNLVQNADKSNPKDNKIHIKGTVLENKKYRISVVDKGIGIPKEHIARVTEDFYMVDKSRSRECGGSGIGLSLVKKIVNLHNSKLFIESEEGNGTTVYFDLKEGTNEN